MYAIRSHYDESRRAEPALRSVVLDHRLLYRRKPSVLRVDPLYRYHMLPANISQRSEAGRHGPVPDLFAIQLSDENIAGAAVSFAASDLGSLQIFLV